MPITHHSNRNLVFYRSSGVFILMVVSINSYYTAVNNFFPIVIIKCGRFGKRQTEKKCLQFSFSLILRSIQPNDRDISTTHSKSDTNIFTEIVYGEKNGYIQQLETPKKKYSWGITAGDTSVVPDTI